MNPDLSAERLLAAYAAGVFPMADDDDGTLHWLAPDPRAVLELDGLYVSRSLRAVVRRHMFDVTINRAFSDVMERCADRSEGTWISAEIKQAYGALHKLGFAHSVESWQHGKLVGGLYGVSLGAMFFGESMFHVVTDASKVALVHLIQQMRRQRFALLDCQFMTDHLRRFGAVEISRRQYERRLDREIRKSRSLVTTPENKIDADERRDCHG